MVGWHHRLNGHEFEQTLGNSEGQGKPGMLQFMGSPGGATPCPRRWLSGHRRAERSYSTFKVRRGGSEEMPLVQGKEQRLCFAEAAVKRYPTSQVRETQVRW